MLRIQCQHCLKIFYRKMVPSNCPKCYCDFLGKPIHLSDRILPGEGAYDRKSRPIILMASGKAEIVKGGMK